MSAVPARARAARMLDGVLTCTPSGCAGLAVNGSTLLPPAPDRAAPQVQLGRVPAQAEQPVRDGEPDERGLVDLRCERHGGQDADHREVLAVQVDLGARGTRSMPRVFAATAPSTTDG